MSTLTMLVSVTVSVTVSDTDSVTLALRVAKVNGTTRGRGKRDA